MASEDIGELFPTKIPGYDDAADIQAALRLYHYGSSTYDETNTDVGDLVRNSIAGQFNNIDERIASIEDSGFGSSISATEPSSPADGFIWMDLDAPAVVSSSAVAAYQSSAPSSPATGTLWVDSTNPSALTLKVYDGSTWKVIS
jgi:hypothetical protein